MGEDSRHRALSRGLLILETVAETRRGLSVTAIAEATGIDRSSTSRLVASLVDLGYLARLEDRRVVLTGRALSLSKGFRQQHDLSEIARPLLADLRDRVGETVIFTVRQGLVSVSIEQLDPNEPFRLVPHIGNAAPLDATAAGRAMLFTLPTGEQRRLIGELAGSAVESPEVRLDHTTWAKEFQLARSRGYVWLPRSDDVERIAAAVVDRNGVAIAAVSVYGPKYRMHDRIEELGRAANQAAARISRAVQGIGRT